VEASIADIEAAVDAAQQVETGEDWFSEGLHEGGKLRYAIKESFGEMREAKREHLHPQESEVRLIPCDGREDPARNAQAGMIVAETTVNSESENALLAPMLEDAQANLGKLA